jgi:threonine dehydratase
MRDLPTIDGVRRAAAALKGVAVVTPLLENEWLNERAQGRILMKAEIFQHGGSFKFRGAYTRLSRLSSEERARGVIAVSSGNHAQGVARAARLYGAPAVILMPKDAPALKVAQVRAYGGEVLFYDRYTEDRESIARALAAERGLALAHPFDQVDTIEGQGTLALEAVEQARAMGAEFDAFITCCGGGGLTAGVAIALESVSPKTEMTLAEPAGFDDAWTSIREGRRVANNPANRTICDAIATPTPGVLTFEVMRRRVTAGFAVTDDEVAETVAWAFKYLKLVLEPGGAAALAAVFHQKIDTRNRVIGLTLSGGNIDPSLFATFLGRLG